MTRASIRKDRETGRWRATRPRYGFAASTETDVFPTQKAAIKWATRGDKPHGTSSTVIERSYPEVDGVASIPVWSPLAYPNLAAVTDAR